MFKKKSTLPPRPEAPPADQILADITSMKSDDPILSDSKGLENDSADPYKRLSLFYASNQKLSNKPPNYFWLEDYSSPYDGFLKKNERLRDQKHSQQFNFEIVRSARQRKVLPLDIFTYRRLPIIKRRAQLTTYCNCLLEFKVRDLGRMYHPRHMSEAICNQNLCSDRTFSCVKKFYKFKALRQRNSTEISDDNVPAALRADWVFDDIQLPVSCECVQSQ